MINRNAIPFHKVAVHKSWVRRWTSLRVKVESRRAVRDVGDDMNAVVFQLNSGVGEADMLDTGQRKSALAGLIQLGNNERLLGDVESQPEHLGGNGSHAAVEDRQAVFHGGHGRLENGTVQLRRDRDLRRYVHCEQVRQRSVGQAGPEYANPGEDRAQVAGRDPGHRSGGGEHLDLDGGVRIFRADGRDECADAAVEQSARGVETVPELRREIGLGQVVTQCALLVKHVPVTA